MALMAESGSWSCPSQKGQSLSPGFVVCNSVGQAIMFTFIVIPSSGKEIG